MISPRGAEVLSRFAIDLLTAYGTCAGNLDHDDLRRRLTGMTDPQTLPGHGASRRPLFDDQLDEAVRVLRQLLELAVIEISWRPGAVEATRTQSFTSVE